MTTTTPCTTHPDLFFAGHIEYGTDDHGGPPKRLTDRATDLSTQARAACLLRCPLAQLRACAQAALDGDSAYGVWAGVQLPGGQTRKLPQLAEKRELLAGIASGAIDPYTHPSNQALLAQREDLALFPAPRPVAARRLQHAVSA